MNTSELITAAQVLLATGLLGVSVRIALGMRSRVSPDLRGRWAVLLGFLVFFILGYLLFLYSIACGVRFSTAPVTGIIFLAGACFTVLVMMVTRTTVKRLVETELELRRYNDSLVSRTAELEQEISERQKAQRGLSESEEKYRSVVESTDDSIYVVDRSRTYIYMNEKHQERLGLATDTYMGRSYGEFHSANQAEWFHDSTQKVFDTGEPAQYEYESERDGRHFLQTMSPVRNDEGEIEAVSVISKNITHLKDMEEELRILTFTDELTGLYNRRGFFTLAEQQLRMANRLKKGVYLLYVDMDYLKLINDNLGHAEGDRALIALAEILDATYRDSDIIARIGGDEFAVFPVESGGSLHGVTERLRGNIEKANAEGKHRFELSVSTGIACYDPEAPVDLEELIREADRSMYSHKKKKPQR